MDGTLGWLARWRLRLSECDIVVQTRPGASHHAADTMTRITTPAVDQFLIPDEVPCLALPKSASAWQGPPQTAGWRLSPRTQAEFLEVQAEDSRCTKVRATMDGNENSRFREESAGLLVLVAPLDGSLQVYVPTHMRYGVMMQEHYPPQAGHTGGNKT